jgi:hypothetical protein
MAAGRLSAIVSANHVSILNRWKVDSLISKRKVAIDRVVLPNLKSLKDLVIDETESLRTRITEVLREGSVEENEV